MKKTLSILVLLLSITFLSCEKESPENEDLVNTDVANFGGDFEGTPDPCCGEENLFERQLQWFSYISAEVVIGNPDARTEFLNLNLNANTEDTAIAISDLIGPDNLAPTFNSTFFDYLVYHIENPYNWPDTSLGTPPPPPTPGGFPDTTPVEVIANIYYDIMLNSNCVELYFPNDLNFTTDNFELTTTSHPLTTSGANEGRRWHFQLLSGGYIHPPAVINPFYAANHTNIFVARPYRTGFQTDSDATSCSYDEYPNIDFEDFLD